MSTAGIEAHGDFTGAGAAGLATNVGFSNGDFDTSPPFGCPACPIFKTVALGPTVVAGFDWAALALASASCFSLSAWAAACSSA